MRDYEGLVKALRENAEWAEGNIWEVPIMLPDNLKQAADAIEELQKRVDVEKAFSGVWEENANECHDRFQKLLDAFPKWISVEDALPKNELETYWVYTSVGSQHSCRWTNNRFGLGVSDKWGWSVFDIPQYTVVTHWMPLLEPPKEET